MENPEPLALGHCCLCLTAAKTLPKLRRGFLEAEIDMSESDTVYERARRHAWFMIGALILAILFVLVVERFFGHSSIAFGVAIVGLVIANARMMTFNCPHCDKNLFVRGMFVVPWPNRVCGRCGARLEDPSQNR